ncbi:AAA family ATPase [Blattabacterium cuenoti]|uniref:AAA family ATPase n=1 Tax=Blattabacterium cuenoti TaxID=1653831 RepID=UPI00163C8F91|nr:ATP-dependent Clp protease ATP-binding subunit [Blattabacterium cuenoti]
MIHYLKKKKSYFSVYLDENIKNDNFNSSYENIGKNKSNLGFYNKNTSLINNTPILNRFGKNLNNIAIEGKIDPLIGRENELERISQILIRRTKNNPLLIGEPGVGKTAIAEGLALNIVKKKVSRILYNKKIIILDITSIISGTKYRGEFEERVKYIIDESEKNPNIILFIDEIHTIIGAGTYSTGSLDISNIFKPALSRGNIQFIGATTLNEYKKYIEKDGALERRFQKIIINPSSEKETINILKNIKYKYENYHNVIYTKEAINACVKLTSRYISDRFFPDKAIDVLDESGSRVYIKNIKVPQEIIILEKRLEEIIIDKSNAIKNKKYKEAAEFRYKKKLIENKLIKAQKNWDKFSKENKNTVHKKHVEEVISMISGIPINRIDKIEIKKLDTVINSIKNKIIGQNEIIEKFIKVIKNNISGMRNFDSPIGSFMFLGKSGVGKTYLTKILSKELFNSEDSLIRIDMSEYMEKFSISRLIGSPPGYVGYEEGGQLTEIIRNRPYSIILFDKIEKAHPDIFNLLLQILDYGYITDSSGKKINFKNTIIIFISNIEIEDLISEFKKIGYKTKLKKNKNKYNKSILKKSLKKIFSYEFLNKINDIVIFNSLNSNDISKIIILELNKLISHVNSLGYKLILDSKINSFIKKIGVKSEYSISSIQKSIDKYLKNTISESIVNGSLKKGYKILLKMNYKKNNIIACIDKK